MINESYDHRNLQIKLDQYQNVPLINQLFSQHYIPKYFHRVLPNKHNIYSNHHQVGYYPFYFFHPFYARELKIKDVP